MEIEIAQGSYAEVANRITATVEFVGRPGKDADLAILSQYVLLSAYESGNAQMQASITLNSQKIELMVTKTELEVVSGRVTTTETRYTQLSNSITLLATKTQLDTVSGRLTTAEASLVITAEAVTTKVSQSVFNAAEARLTTNETLTLQTAFSLTLKASQTSVDTLTQRTTNTEASLVIAQNAITTKVSRTEYDAQNNIISTLQTRVTQTEQAITTMATATTINALTGRVTVVESTTQQLATSITQKVNVTVTDELGNRITVNEGAITILNNAVNIRVTNDTFNALGQVVASNSASISVLNGQITSKASQTTVDSLTGRMATAESQIQLNKDSIQLKVSATDFTGETIVSMINQSPTTVKIFAKNIQLEGAVVATSLSSGKIRINVNNGDLEVLHDNGILGIRAGTDVGGRAILQGFNDAGTKLWDLDTFTQNGGVQYVNTVPDSTVALEGTRLQAYTVSPPTAQEELTMSQAIKGMFLYTNVPGSTSTHPMQNVKIDQRSFSNMIKFTAGTPDTNKQYNGYHTDGMTGPWVSDGWYVFDGNKGTKYAAADWNGPGSQYITVSIIAIVNGQQVASRAIEIPVT